MTCGQKGNALTMEVWIKPDAIPSSDQGFISTGDNGLGLKVNARGDHPYFELFVDGWAAGTAATARLPDNYADGNWHQLVGMCAADKTLHFYWDGQELPQYRGSVRPLPPFDSASEALTVGLDSASADRVFTGAIDSVRIYERELTAEEMADPNRTMDDEGVVYWLDFTDDEIESKRPIITGWMISWTATIGATAATGSTAIPMRTHSAQTACYFADRTPTAKAVEVRKVHQQVNFYDDGKATQGEVRVVNEFENTNLDQ